MQVNQIFLISKNVVLFIQYELILTQAQTQQFFRLRFMAQLCLIEIGKISAEGFFFSLIISIKKQKSYRFLSSFRYHELRIKKLNHLMMVFKSK